VRRLLGAIVVVIVLATVFFACRQYLPTNRYLQPRRASVSQSTADARGKFNHQGHARVFDAGQVTCIDCHRFDAVIESDNAEMAKELSMHAQYPGGEACHYCHRGDTKMSAAPGTCTTCHENLQPLRPEDHDVAWLKVHAGVARTQPAQCESCHRQAECIDCHQRRDSIQTVMHERNFRFFHSVAAKANPMQCGSCHREDFCIQCHQRGKVELEP
jgi:nitrate/TMAO reductase-like tetraheme cytochrome c subunit